MRHIPRRLTRCAVQVEEPQESVMEVEQRQAEQMKVYWQVRGSHCPKPCLRDHRF